LGSTIHARGETPEARRLSPALPSSSRFVVFVLFEMRKRKPYFLFRAALNTR